MNNELIRSRDKNKKLFRELDLIVDKIQLYAAEPQFSQDIERRYLLPSFETNDEYILKRMIILIAFSEAVRSDTIQGMLDRGVFENVFPSFLPSDVSKIDSEILYQKYWNSNSPEERLAPLRFPKKLEKMIACALSLQKIALTHGTFMNYLNSQGLPLRIHSYDECEVFWEKFDTIRQDIGVPFFENFISLCHLLQDLGFDCAKPDSRVMGVAEDLGIVDRITKGRKHSQREQRKVIQTMQLYAAYKNIPTPVVDLYFLIHGGQTDAKKFVIPSYYDD